MALQHASERAGGSQQHAASPPDIDWDNVDDACVVDDACEHDNGRACGFHNITGLPDDWWNDPQDIDWDDANVTWEPDDEVPSDDAWEEPDDGPDGPPYYTLEDVPGWDADAIRARAEGFLYLQVGGPDDYQRLADDFDKRGVITREQLDNLVNVQRYKPFKEAQEAERAARQRKIINDAVEWQAEWAERR